MIKIFRKKGWIMNPNDTILNKVIKRIEGNGGECPCYNQSIDKRCPCSDYRDNDICHCGLYIKAIEDTQVSDYMSNPASLEEG